MGGGAAARQSFASKNVLEISSPKIDTYIFLLKISIIFSHCCDANMWFGRRCFLSSISFAKINFVYKFATPAIFVKISIYNLGTLYIEFCPDLPV
jgi:hypothetical protein